MYVVVFLKEGPILNSCLQKNNLGHTNLGDVCTLSAQALKKLFKKPFLSHKSFLDKFFIGIQDFRDKVPNCETRIIIRSSSQGYLLRGIGNCLVFGHKGLSVPWTTSYSYTRFLSIENFKNLQYTVCAPLYILFTPFFEFHFFVNSVLI